MANEATFITSGEAAITTSGLEEKVAITAPTGGWFRQMHFISISNGAVAGFFSTDGGTTWVRMAANQTNIFREVRFSGNIMVKGTNLADVFVSIW